MKRTVRSAGSASVPGRPASSPSGAQGTQIQPQAVRHHLPLGQIPVEGRQHVRRPLPDTADRALEHVGLRWAEAQKNHGQGELFSDGHVPLFETGSPRAGESCAWNDAVSGVSFTMELSARSGQARRSAPSAATGRRCRSGPLPGPSGSVRCVVLRPAGRQGNPDTAHGLRLLNLSRSGLPQTVLYRAPGRPSERRRERGERPQVKGLRRCSPGPIRVCVPQTPCRFPNQKGNLL